MSRRLKGAFCVFGDFYKSAKASPGLSPPPVAAFGAAALWARGEVIVEFIIVYYSTL